MRNNRAIYFDMDGTIANLYAVNGWLDDLNNERTRPYKDARPMVNMNVLARRLNTLKRKGWTIGIVTWLSKNGTTAYNEEVTEVKRKWIKKHLATVQFDEFHAVEYGTPKEEVVNCPFGILFDDEVQNRNNWIGTAYNEENILEVLKGF